VRFRDLPWVSRRPGRALLVLALLTVMLPRPALAEDALIPHVASADDGTLVQQTGPAATAPSSVQLVPTTQFVEDPTRQAGGEDDAQRASERQIDQQQDDDGDRRRK
jgi:hypothetical protein